MCLAMRTPVLSAGFIVISGCSLMQLIGRRFRIGNVLLRGLASHEICASEYPHQATSCMALHDADLRAEILTAGSIAVGDRLQAV